jgi:hypothetical protein
MWDRAASRLNKIGRLKRRPRRQIDYLFGLMNDLEALGADNGRYTQADGGAEHGN